MKKKKFSGLILGAIAMQFIIPTFNGSEVTSTNIEPSQIAAIANPVKANRALPTDLVTIPDESLKQAIATELGVAAAEITVEDMGQLKRLNCNNCGITNLSGLEYATILEDVDLSDNQITDISSLSNSTAIKFLDLSNNQISDLSVLSNFPILGNLDISVNQVQDLTPLSALNHLSFLDVSSNQVSDISPIQPLIAAATLHFVTATDQTINLDPITVYTKDEIFFNVVDINGANVPISLGIPNQGLNSFSAPFDVNDTVAKVRLTGTINQDVTFRSITGDTDATSTEESTLTDAQLITLFNVESVEGQVITVDQSAVDYSTPGKYPVTFIEGDNIDQITSFLTISDVKPTIAINNPQVVIELGTNIDDLVNSFGVTATEFTDGDLTASIEADDSSVDYNTPGTYIIIFSVKDAEVNVVKVNGQLDINEKQVITPDEGSEEKSEVVSENTQTPTEESQTSPLTLATTGGKIIIGIGILAIILIIIIFAKRVVNKKD